MLWFLFEWKKSPFKKGTITKLNAATYMKLSNDGQYIDISNSIDTNASGILGTYRRYRRYRRYRLHMTEYGLIMVLTDYYGRGFKFTE